MSEQGVTCVGCVIDPDGHPAFKFLCDCDTTSVIVVEDLAERSDTDALEFAFTCRVCHESHWLTISRAVAA